MNKTEAFFRVIIEGQAYLYALAQHKGDLLATNEETFYKAMDDWKEETAKQVKELTNASEEED